MQPRPPAGSAPRGARGRSKLPFLNNVPGLSEDASGGAAAASKNGDNAAAAAAAAAGGEGFPEGFDMENAVAQHQATLMDASQVVDKQSLCLDILTNGYVNSFVDFFYLTHRSGEDATRSQQIPDEHLPFVKQNLTDAEKNHRRGESANVFEAYQQLAFFFRDSGDIKTCIYFFEKCLDMAQFINDLSASGDSLRNLGLAHDSLGDIATAIVFHERHLGIARHIEDDDRLTQANKELVEAFRRYAEDFARKDDLNNAIKFYDKCRQAASGGGDLPSEGLATYRLGMAHAKLKNFDQAVEYQQQYLDICKRLGDQLGEGAACAALASAFEEMGDSKLAIRYLERHLDIATRNKQSVAQAEACAALGSIYSANGNHERGVSFFERSFDIARAVGDRKLVDQARIKLGMARGNLAMGNYMSVVNSDLGALLKWKTRRVNFGGGGGNGARVGPGAGAHISQ